MNARSIVAQTKKVSDITKFVFGKQRYVNLEMDCVAGSWDPTPEVDYRLYISVPKDITPDGEGFVTYQSDQWKHVLALITWLEQIEVPKPVRYLDQ